MLLGHREARAVCTALHTVVLHGYLRTCYRNTRLRLVTARSVDVMSTQARGGHWTPGSRVTDVCEPRCECVENVGPLEEEPVPLTRREPSLQPPNPLTRVQLSGRVLGQCARSGFDAKGKEMRLPLSNEYCRNGSVCS